MGIGKNTQPVKALFFNKLQQFIEIFLRFAGVAHQ